MPLSAFQRPKAHALAFFYQLSMQCYFHSPLKASDHADSSNIDGQDQKRKKKFKKDKALQDTKKMRYPDLWFCIFLSSILFFWFTSLYYKFTFTMLFVNPKTSQLNKRQVWMQRLKREIVYNSKLSNATVRQVSYPVRFNFCCSPLVLTGKRMVKIILYQQLWLWRNGRSLLYFLLIYLGWLPTNKISIFSEWLFLPAFIFL